MLGEFQEPVNIFLFELIAIFFLSSKSKWRRGQNQIYRIAGKLFHYIEAISKESTTKLRPVIGFDNSLCIRRFC